MLWLLVSHGSDVGEFTVCDVYDELKSAGSRVFPEGLKLIN